MDIKSKKKEVSTMLMINAKDKKFNFNDSTKMLAPVSLITIA